MTTDFSKSTGTYQSSNGKTTIHYYIISPTEKPKVILQFLHGMAEHSQRYVAFGEFLAKNGIAFCISDHLGHGESKDNDDELGYFGKKNGWKTLVTDAKKLTDILKQQYPDVPFFIGGHSMGSFVCRSYISHYPNEAKGAIIVGTGNATPIVALGKPLAKTIGFFKGNHYRSKLLDQLSFGAYNKQISNAKTSFDWLSENEENVQTYIDDPLCGYLFTTNGYADVAALMWSVSSQKWADSINKDLPILLVSGKQDPVGNYGKGIEKITEMLSNSGVKSVTVKLYETARHEVLNEKYKEQVFQDIFSWIKER
ncbi:alpha/beta hydrolase [Paludicola sp. MB14-C6]|uniref:alpha/beta fold hydrolase n=1 Tax=Paludihabitans sp. MB14-C6 TaxID=3070656 RepID=UPI0027DC7BED|nr:alpha/beta hydrolase [Paludicola sp. MB14-C6]WMJ23779.1 alpha/beta hydrolase [Paludicola sp. MB14-C6]